MLGYARGYTHAGPEGRIAQTMLGKDTAWGLALTQHCIARGCVAAVIFVRMCACMGGVLITICVPIINIINIKGACVVV